MRVKRTVFSADSGPGSIGTALSPELYWDTFLFNDKCGRSTFSGAPAAYRLNAVSALSDPLL